MLLFSLPVDAELPSWVFLACLYHYIRNLHHYIRNLYSYIFGNQLLRFKSLACRIVAVLNTLLEAINISKEGSFQRILGNYAIDVSSVSDARLFTGVTFSGNINDALSDPLRNTSVLKTPFDDTVVNSSKATTIRFPRTLFNESSLVTLGPQTIILALYKETKFFRVVPKPPKSLNSFVVAGRIRGLSVSNLTHPVEITFADLKRGDKNGSLCSFWNFERGNWSQDGCSLQKILPDGRIVCNCNHLTNFAVLMVS